MSRARRFRFRRPGIGQAQIERFRAIAQCKLREELDAGNLNDDECLRALRSTESDRVIKRIIRKYGDATDEAADKNGEIRGIAWDRIIDWFKEHWFDILKLFLSALMFLGPEEGEDDE